MKVECEQLKVSTKVDMSLTELQTILHMVSDLSHVDPGVINVKSASSMPFFFINSFEELCEQVLFNYVYIIETNEGPGFTVDFNRRPIGLY